MEWFPLSLACAFTLATADAMTKRWLAGYSAGELVVVRFLVPGIILLPVLVLWPPTRIQPALLPWLAALLPFEILAMWLYMRAISTSPLASTLPYLAFTPVFAALTGWLMLGETVSARGLAGITLVVAGAWLLNIDSAAPRPARRWHRLLHSIAREPGSRTMLLVSALYGLTSVMGKGALRHIDPLSFGPLYFVLLGVISAVVFSPGGRRPMRALQRHPAASLAVGVAMAAMIVTHFLAVSRVEVAYMITVKRTSLLFGILYGALWFNEPRLGANLAAGALMVAGVALVVV